MHSVVLRVLSLQHHIYTFGWFWPPVTNAITQSDWFQNFTQPGGDILSASVSTSSLCILSCRLAHQSLCFSCATSSALSHFRLADLAGLTLHVPRGLKMVEALRTCHVRLHMSGILAWGFSHSLAVYGTLPIKNKWAKIMMHKRGRNQDITTGSFKSTHMFPKCS